MAAGPKNSPQVPMQVRIASLEEPVPGYRLLEPLGKGGFGEVWKAIAPGGVLKAVKLVHGNLQSAVEGGEEIIAKELKSLELVKSVRHPYLLALDRYDVVQGQLLIVMELADRSLWDRFTEARKEKLPGIPRAELLHYMSEAAEALDLMNLRYGLQHSDVKPQNLFLVHRHIKVADFGLVRDLEGMKAAKTGGVSPLYAAPETFEGWVSRYSDQYSLGIVYQEMLTGQRPFDGTNGRQLLMQHVQMPPNLSSLPAADRSAVARALAKDPADRFASCGAFVQALRGTPAPPRLSALKPVRTASDSWPNNPRPSPQLAVVGERKTVLLPLKQPTPLKERAAVAVRCPGCGYIGQVPPDYLGKAIRCRDCRLISPAFPVPATSRSARTDTPLPAPLEAKAVSPEIAVLTDVECPVCGNVGRIPESSHGRSVKCRRCGCVHR